MKITKKGLMTLFCQRNTNYDVSRLSVRIPYSFASLYCNSVRICPEAD